MQSSVYQIRFDRKLSKEEHEVLSDVLKAIEFGAKVGLLTSFYDDYSSFQPLLITLASMKKNPDSFWVLRKGDVVHVRLAKSCMHVDVLKYCDQIAGPFTNIIQALEIKAEMLS